MAKALLHEGGSFRGSVRYRVTGEPLSSSICHCASCRGASGARSAAWLVFPLDRFSLVSRDPAEYRSSPGVSRTFRGRCGTPPTYRHEDTPDSTDVTTASLEFPDEFPPTHHVWLEDKVGWEHVDDGLARFVRLSTRHDGHSGGGACR